MEINVSTLPEFDQAGFLSDPDAWDESTAERIAALAGISPLTDEHWKIIHALRGHYAEFGTPPSLPHACRTAGLDPLCMDELFHSARDAWRVAGLPDPGEEAKSYM